MTLTPLTREGKIRPYAYRLDLNGKHPQLFPTRAAAVREMERIARGEVMSTDLKGELIVILSSKSAVKEKEFSLSGRSFPLAITKRFVSTFKANHDWSVYVVGEELRFFWGNGKAHINSIAKANELKDQSGRKA